MGKRDITIEDIARDLGVSKSTVSRALSGKGRIGEETRRRVEAYVKQHEYKPNVLARGLAQSRTYNIAVVFPDDYCLMEMPFFMQCLTGIHEAAVAGDYDILLTMGDNGHLDSMKKVIDHKKADGIILMRSYVEDRTVSFLQAEHIPFVVIGSHRDPQVVQVDQLNRKACYEMTEALLKQGFKNPALLGGDQNHQVTRDRYAGFSEACEAAGVNVLPELVCLDLIDSEKIEAAALNTVHQGADCLICMDDNICEIVLRRFQKESLRVPEDICIASYFDSPMWEHNQPGISCISFDVRSQGRAAGSTIIDLVEERPLRHCDIQPYKINIRASTTKK